MYMLRGGAAEMRLYLRFDDCVWVLRVSPEGPGAAVTERGEPFSFLFRIFGYKITKLAIVGRQNNHVALDVPLRRRRFGFRPVRL